MFFPRFKYNLSTPSSNDFGYITLNNVKIHHIHDVNEFYRALGYTDAIRMNGAFPEEFIWEKYHKDNCEKSEACLQVKIIEYLIRHSATFKMQYATQIEGWLEKCLVKKMSGAPECNGCKPI